jgi:subtilisin family serine protease
MSRREDDSFRGWRYEAFEERLALSVQPVADFWYDTAADSIAEPSSTVVQPLGSTEGHGWTDLAAARDLFGLRGSGQTVAIIDSGIAYDDTALGGGLGSSYKVVGGWDFAENDANPYDDGPAGFHGTHVSGIVGSQDSRYAGVAPNVDLVGLRVFDDQGNGYFTWVDQALEWVHTHRNDYEFPITTVNLSLGTEWNASTLPQWATLENDLKQLADDGIFISVAAGNSFMNYNAAGLSYPAVSPNVTPVASVDANGNLSRFSQRNDHVLAAPGEKIMSTLPPAFYGDSSNKTNFGAASGTSMAAPYVAGASVLVREAMQDLGYTSINQSAIDDLFHRTADRIFDSATNASYDRINVARALNTLVGPDDFGGAGSGSSSIGQLATTLHVSGTINSTTDQDYFHFTAARSGKVTLTLTDPQQLAAAWQPMAGEQIAGNKLTLNVSSGQNYVVGVAGGGATIGKYDVDMQLTPAAPTQSFTAVNWGSIDQRSVQNVAISGDAWFQVTAGHNGRFTAETSYAQNRGNVDLEIYNSQQQLVGASNGTNGSERIDVDVAAGDTLFLHIKGANPDVDFRLTNLVSIHGGSATVTGTAGNDSMRWQADGRLSINGVTYSLGGVTEVTIDGSGGNDSLALVGGSAAESVVLRPGSADVIAANYHVAANGFENIQFSGGSGDRATLYDSSGDDTFEATPQSARMSGSGFVNSVSGVGSVIGIAQAGGSDTARLYDSAGDDTLTASPTSAVLQGSGFSNEARGFSQVFVIATAGGYDTASLSDSAGADQLDASPSYVWLRGTGYSIRADGFDYIAVVATYGGSDTARLVGSEGDDYLGVWLNQRDLYTSTVQIHTYNFQTLQFDGGGGYDSVNYYQAARNASLYGRSSYGQINDQIFATQFSGVEAVMASVRSSQRLRTDLAALDFAFQRMGRK